MEKEKIKQEKDALESRKNTVVKANALIQKSRFSLSVQQQKIVLFLISQITQFDTDFKLYEFSIKDFCKVCGINYTSGKNYQDVKNAIKEIADKSLWIRLDNGEETLLRWIEKPYISREKGTIKIKLDADMKPFLLQLKENFTQYELLWTLRFNGKYTIRLYELIKSIHFAELETYTREYTLDDLRQLLDAQGYTTYQTFKTRVLIPAVDEINRYSDKILEYEPLKLGRSVHSIRFTIKTKNPTERMRLQCDIEKYLGEGK
jgi:plasmid replication initiation protein